MAEKPGGHAGLPLQRITYYELRANHRNPWTLRLDPMTALRRFPLPIKRSSLRPVRVCRMFNIKYLTLQTAFLPPASGKGGMKPKEDYQASERMPAKRHRNTERE